MSILEYNGGATVAMRGKNCVGIASDLRFGVKFQTVNTSFSKVFQMSDRIFMGLAGLATDVQTLHEKMQFKLNMYTLREEREMSPRVFGELLSNTLYEKRFGPYFAEPIVAGLEGPDYRPYLVGMDLIGAPVYAEDFVLAGTCGDSLFGMCESMYRPDMEPDELFEALSQAMLASADRDAYTGWGAVVHIITPDRVVSKMLKGRQD